MNGFDGFPRRMQFTPIPNVFITTLLRDIMDIVEIKVILQVFRILYYRKGSIKYVTFGELLNEGSLKNDIEGTAGERSIVLKRALESLKKRKVIIEIASGENDTGNIYLINNAENRDSLEKIESGEIKLEGIVAKEIDIDIDESEETFSNVYTMYEENIGIITPMIAEQLRDAEKNYPEVWIKAAIKESVNAGKRNWRYISAILERWEVEGKSDGTHLRHFKKTDPDKFIKGKYGNSVRR